MSEYSSYDHFNSEVSDKIKNLAKMAESSTIIAPRIIHTDGFETLI